MKRNILVIFSKSLNVFCLCYRHASFFRFFIFNKFPVAYAFHMCAEYDKWSKSIQTRYNTTYICPRCYIRTRIYVFLLSVKKCAFELSWVWPWRWPRGGTPYMLFVGPVFHHTTKKWLKRVRHHTTKKWLKRVGPGGMNE